MSLSRRLCRLESLSDGCSECGHSPGVPEEYEVIWHDEGNSEGSEDAGPEYCEACGRQTTFIVEWDDLDGMEPWNPFGGGIPGGVGR